jgi:Ribonuclease G/E
VLSASSTGLGDSLIGNVYLDTQNVLPSMEAAFVDTRAQCRLR